MSLALMPHPCVFPRNDHISCMVRSLSTRPAACLESSSSSTSWSCYPSASISTISPRNLCVSKTADENRCPTWSCPIAFVRPQESPLEEDQGIPLICEVPSSQYTCILDDHPATGHWFDLVVNYSVCDHYSFDPPSSLLNMLDIVC